MILPHWLLELVLLLGLFVSVVQFVAVVELEQLVDEGRESDPLGGLLLDLLEDRRTKLIMVTINTFQRL